MPTRFLLRDVGAFELAKFKFVLCWMALVFASIPAPAFASRQAAHICDQVAVLAARESGVPVDVMRAITRVETGRNSGGMMKPWPWTVNMEGAGRWFETEDEARAFVFRHFKRGARSFDVGCFQINYKWHHQAFRSIDEMFDPELNARYAASFLRRLFNELGDWSKAAGAYHSRTPTYASRYARKFEKVRTALGPVDTSVPDSGPARIAPANLFAQGTGRPAAPGSLVRLSPAAPSGRLSFFRTQNTRD